MRKEIRFILENLGVIAVVERLTPEQQEKLMVDVLHAMLDDPSIDPRTQMGIRMGFEQGLNRDHTDYVYEELTGELHKIDPTENHSYTNFILRLYSKGGVGFAEVISSDFHDCLVAYNELKKRNRLKPPYNDMNTFKTIKEFTQFIDENKGAIKFTEQAAGTSETVYEDDEVKIVVPLDQAASCRYGKGTKWCVSGLAANAFDRYNSHGRLYFFIPKNPKYPAEKYAMHFAKEEFVNDEDKAVDHNYILRNRFGDLVSAFFKDNKDFKEWLQK